MLKSGVHHAVNPDPYRGAFGSDAEKYARDVQEIIEFGTTGHVAGFISAAIQVRYTDAAGGERGANQSYSVIDKVIRL